MTKANKNQNKWLPANRDSKLVAIAGYASAIINLAGALIALKVSSTDWVGNGYRTSPTDWGLVTFHLVFVAIPLPFIYALSKFQNRWYKIFALVLFIALVLWAILALIITIWALEVSHVTW